MAAEFDNGGIPVSSFREKPLKIKKVEKDYMDITDEVLTFVDPTSSKFLQIEGAPVFNAVTGGLCEAASILSRRDFF